MHQYTSLESFEIKKLFVNKYGLLLGAYLSFFIKYACTQEEWFTYSHMQQIKDLHLTKKKVKTCKHFFAANNIISLKRINGKEMYKLNLETLLNIVTDA